MFRTERAGALSARSSGDREAVLTRAGAALAEYRGELMPGSYDEWVLDARDCLRRECVDLCDVATAAWRESGDPVRAAEAVRRRIQLEPLEEVGYRVLMELQAESGDRAAAVSTFHRCASVLEHELGISPAPDTEMIVARLLPHRTAPTLPAGAASGLSRGVGPAGAGLVGRDGEVGMLLGRWRQATAGGGGLVVVSGEAGVGKSRLVAELTASARAEGAVVATTRCFGLSGRPALAPVAEWLRSDDLRSATAGLEPVWRVEVERLVPDPMLGRGGGEERVGRSPVDPGQVARVGTSGAMVDAWRRHRFFEGLARAVLSADRPALLVLDDLQWCDQETMAWLAFLLRFATDAPVLVAATVRADELENNRDVCAGLRALRSAGLVTEVTLAPLEPAGTAELAAALLNRPLTASEQVVLHAATGGYPLFILEAARSVSDAATPAPPLPVADLRTVLSRRLEQPFPAGREVAGLAAALGRDFSLDLLTEASDLDPDTLVQAVDELWRRRILREQRGGYDFSHDLLREVAYAAVTPPRRWLLHRRLAQGIELLHAGRVDDVAGQLAEQYDRGGRPDRALGYYRRAAEAAARVFANAEALRHHRRSLELVGKMPPGRDRDTHELDVLQAMSAPLNAVHGYSSPQLQSTLERSGTLAERLRRPNALLGSLIGLFTVRFVQGQTALAHELATRALTLAEAGPALAGQAHFVFAGSATSLGLLTTAITHFDRACELSSGAVSLIVGTRLEVHAQAWAAHACWLLGDDEQAVLRCTDAVERGRAIDHPYTLAVALAFAAITHQIRADTASLTAAVAELRELCRVYEFAYYREWALILGGWASGGERGAAQIRRGIDRLRSQGAHARMPYWLSLLAEVQIDCGRTEAAGAVLDAARVAGEQCDDRWWLPEVWRLRAGLEPGPAAVDLLAQADNLAGTQASRTLQARCRADLAARGVRHPSARVSAPRSEANGVRTPGT